MKRGLYLYWCYACQMIKTRLAYRANFLMVNLIFIPMMLSQILFIYLVLDKVHHIRGYGFWEIMTVYSFSSLTVGITFFMLGHFGSISQMVQDGSFDQMLIRPIRPFWHFAIRRINDEWLLTIITRGVLLGISLAQLGITWTWLSYVYLFWALACAILINIGLKVIVTALTFWLYETRALHSVLYATIYDLSYYPVALYGKFIENLLTWVFPLAFVSIVPVSYFFPDLNMKGMNLLMPLVTAVVLAGAVLSWHYGLKRYESAGS
ncbi:ABC transporter permease [Planctomycetota bacterium]